MKNFYLTLCALFLFTAGSFAQVPKLNSFPSANAVIFLDFDGHVVQGTSWNYDGPIFCNSANLNTTQLTEVFNRISEDYRPFNINVTTDSTVYQAAPAKRRMRLVLTTSSSWYGAAGGVAYTNSFTWGDNTPCFVFTALLNYNVKNISEAASHEIGHTLGLNHQSAYDTICNKTSEYNSGTGSGEVGWAPIMGVGYYRNLTLWHFGSNPFGCSYMQDDLGIITSEKNGFGFRSDDHGNTPASATNAVFSNNRFTLKGVIEMPNDVDIIKFNLPAGSKLQINALPYSAAAGNSGANVDLQVELTNSTGTAVSVYNPSNALSASVDTMLGAGTYYLKVVSKGNSFAPDFASLGSYDVIMMTSPVALPVHKLELKGSIDNNRHKLDWEIVADEKIVSQTVELSTGSATFQSLKDVSEAARNYTYLPSASSHLAYRLKVTFDNGRTYYSNTVSLRGTGTGARPALMGNRISSSLTINSPSLYQYSIFDMNGRLVTKGQLTQGLNNISAGLMAHGLYVIHFSNNQEQYTEKFSKQ